MNKRFEYIKEASPFGSLRQIPERFKVGDKVRCRGSQFEIYLDKGEYGYNIAGPAGVICGIDVKDLEPLLPFDLPHYPLSVQPSEEWMQRKEYEEGVDFKFSYEEISQDRYFQTYITSSSHPLNAIPIEKKDDLVASQNHPQPLDSVATLACTEGNSIEQ